jgi:phosphate/sulfate permease
MATYKTNDVGATAETPFWLLLIGGGKRIFSFHNCLHPKLYFVVAIVIGLATLGYRVMSTVSLVHQPNEHVD